MLDTMDTKLPERRPGDGDVLEQLEASQAALSSGVSMRSISAAGLELADLDPHERRYIVRKIHEQCAHVVASDTRSATEPEPGANHRAPAIERTERALLVERLLRYGTHKSSCGWWMSSPCSCGWAEVQAQVQTLDREQEGRPGAAPARDSFLRQVAARALLDEVEAACRRYGMSITHEDDHGAFELVPYDPDMALDAKMRLAPPEEPSRLPFDFDRASGVSGDLRTDAQRWIDHIDRLAAEDDNVAAPAPRFTCPICESTDLVCRYCSAEATGVERYELGHHHVCHRHGGEHQ